MKFGKFHKLSEKRGSRVASRAYDQSVDKTYVDNKIDDLKKDLNKSGVKQNGENHYTVVPGEGLGGDSETLLVIDLTVGSIVGRLSARGRLVSHPVVFGDKVGFTVARGKTLMGTIHKLPSGALVDQFRVQGGGDIQFEPIFQRKADIDKALAKQLDDPNSAFGKNIGDYRTELEQKLKHQKDITAAHADAMTSQEERFDAKMQQLKDREDKLEALINQTGRAIVSVDKRSEGAKKGMDLAKNRPSAEVARLKQMLGAEPETSDQYFDHIETLPKSDPVESIPVDVQQKQEEHERNRINARRLNAQVMLDPSIENRKAAEAAQAQEEESGKALSAAALAAAKAQGKPLRVPQGHPLRPKSKTTPAQVKAAVDRNDANAVKDTRRLGDKKGKWNP